jgi:aryl-alcohol dehydrogenase-like predicted oxidoreductase
MLGRKEVRMRYQTLGRSALKVSELCLGTMTFGSNFHTIAENTAEQAREMLGKAWDAGVNFIDTADIYSYGESERIVGQAIRELEIPRDKLVLATKVCGPMSEAAQSGSGDVNNIGLSRKHILESCHASLKRLQTDYIDLYQLHGWDIRGSLEEALSALDHLVRDGKVLYVGVSNWPVRHIARALALADAHLHERFVSLQAYYSLVGRDVEHELVPLCLEQELGLLPWSPLAGGFLSGKFRRGQEGPNDARRTRFDFPPIDRERGLDAVEKMAEIAAARGVSIAQIAIAWLRSQPAVTSVILGANKLDQLEDNLAAADLELKMSEVESLSAITEPAKLYPQWMVERMNAGR